MEYYKKIDKSFFRYGVITIPGDKVEGFLHGKSLKKGDRLKIDLRWKGKKESYPCWLYRSKRTSGKHDYYQIKWTNNLELNRRFKIEFIQTYMAIQSLKYADKPDGKFKKTDLLGGTQEVLIFRPVSIGEIELETFIKIETPYDGIFKRLVTENVFGWLSKTEKDYLITKSSKWYNIDELSDHNDTKYVVYYLIDDDEKKKEIYIGSAKRLGDRVKPKRPEIKGWTKFKYDVIHPDYHHLLRRIEFQAIRAFASFFENYGGDTDCLSVSEYRLVNINWPKRK